MTLPPGYNWKVVIDPTRTGFEPGLFFGGHFRWLDIKTRGECPFPDGTVFQHIKTGEIAFVEDGKVIREKFTDPNRFHATASGLYASPAKA